MKIKIKFGLLMLIMILMSLSSFAWTYDFQNSSGGIYLPMNYDLDGGGDIPGEDLGSGIIDCNAIGGQSPVWSSSDVDGIWVNDSISNYDFQDLDICKISDNTVVDINNEDFYISVWFDSDTKSDTSFLLYWTEQHGVGGDIGYINVYRNGGSDQLTVYLRDYELGGAGTQPTISNIDIGDISTGKHNLIITYDYSESDLFCILDGEIVLSDLSFSDFDINLSDNYNAIGGSFTSANFWDGFIDEFYFQDKIFATPEIVDKLYNVSHYSSLIFGDFDLNTIDLFKGDNWSYNYGFTDEIDPLIYYVNDSRFDINETGFINISNVNIGLYHVNINVTDMFGNWRNDNFILNVKDIITPPIIDQICPDDTPGVLLLMLSLAIIIGIFKIGSEIPIIGILGSFCMLGFGVVYISCMTVIGVSLILIALGSFLWFGMLSMSSDD